MYKEEVIDTYKRIINSRGYKEFKLTRNELITKICHKVGAAANNKNIAKVRKILQEVE